MPDPYGNHDLANAAGERYGDADSVHAGNGDLAHAGAASDAGAGGTPAPPVAEFTYDPPNPSTTDLVTFDGSASKPGEGEQQITGYDWLFNNTATRTGTVVTWRLPSGAGDYDATLTVTTTGNLTDSTTQVLSVVLKEETSDA